jgi:hypothetical protein
LVAADVAWRFERGAVETGEKAAHAALGIVDCASVDAAYARRAKRLHRDGIRSAESEQGGRYALLLQTAHFLLGQRVQRLAIDRASPDHFRAQHAIQRKIAGEVVRRLACQDQQQVDADPGRCRRAQAGMVALRNTHRHSVRAPAATWTPQ